MPRCLLSYEICDRPGHQWIALRQLGVVWPIRAGGADSDIERFLRGLNHDQGGVERIRTGAEIPPGQRHLPHFAASVAGGKRAT